MMLGHACKLTQTNTFGWVPVCECGWIGDVVPATRAGREKTARTARAAELAQSVALTRHGGHVLEVTADIERRSEMALATIGRNITAANRTLQRRGRWGNP